MNRKILEKATINLAVILMFAMTIGLILIFANFIFAWDIFTPATEKIIYFLGLCMLIVILASTFINLMINISRLAFFMEKITEKMYEVKKNRS